MSVTISANVNIGVGVFSYYKRSSGGFTAFYENNGKKAGTYTMVDRTYDYWTNK